MNRDTIEHRLTVLQAMTRDTKAMAEDLAGNVASYLGTNQAAVDAKNAREENWVLRQALAYYYTPTVDEYREWEDHCNEVNACGGKPPGEVIHWSDIALARYERHHG